MSAAFIFLARSWLSERIHQSIRYEYEQKLAFLNAQLKNESEKSMLLLKSSIEQESEKFRLATNSVNQTQQEVIGRRLKALETLWEGVLAARINIPVVMGFIEILTDDQYASMKDHPDFKAMVGDVSQEKMEAMYKDDLGFRERARPYVGEYTWALASTYQSVILHAAFLVQWGKEDDDKLKWYLDPGINRLLKSVFTENELNEFESIKINKIGWIRSNFESKILAAIEIVISGEQFGKDALHQARLMEEEVRQLEAQQNRKRQMQI